MPPPESKKVKWIEALCEKARPHFEEEDQQLHIEEIAIRLRQISDLDDRIVLAQPSMARTAAPCADRPIPVL